MPYCAALRTPRRVMPRPAAKSSADTPRPSTPALRHIEACIHSSEFKWWSWSSFCSNFYYIKSWIDNPNCSFQGSRLLTWFILTDKWYVRTLSFEASKTKTIPLLKSLLGLKTQSIYTSNWNNSFFCSGSHILKAWSETGPSKLWDSLYATLKPDTPGISLIDGWCISTFFFETF